MAMGRFASFLLAAVLAVLLFADLGAMAASPKKKPASPKKKSPPAKRPLILAGPTIRYIDTTDSFEWKGTVQIVTQMTAAAPVLSYTYGINTTTTTKATGVQTNTYKLGSTTYYFWRFDVSVPLDEEAMTVSYSFTNVWATARLPTQLFQFTVAADTAAFKIGFFTGDSYPAGGNSTWSTLLDQHIEEPFHLLVGVGNVINNNGIFNVPAVKAIYSTAASAQTAWINAEWTPALEKAVQDYYFSQYLAAYGSNSYMNRVMAQIPQNIMYDESEIFSGYGAHANLELQFSDAYTGIADLAVSFYRLFNVHDTDVKPTTETFIDPGFTSLKYAGFNSRLLMLDGRASRNPSVAVGAESLPDIYTKLNALPVEVDYVYVATAQNPVMWKLSSSNLTDASLFPEMVAPLATKSPFGDSALGTSIASEWSSAALNKGREYFLGNLTAISNTTLLRFAFISGGSGYMAATSYSANKAELNITNDPLMIPGFALGPIAAAPGSAFPCALANTLANSTHKLATGNVYSTFNLFEDRSIVADGVPAYPQCGAGGLYLQPVRGFGVVAYDDEELATVVSMWWEGPTDKEFTFYDFTLYPLYANATIGFSG